MKNRLYKVLTVLVLLCVLVSLVPTPVSSAETPPTFLFQMGSIGSGDGLFSYPRGIAVEPEWGNVYVADRGNDRIQIFTALGTYLGKFGTEGSDPGQFQAPKGVAIDSAGNVYVIDNFPRIQKFDKTGTFLAQWGEYGEEPGQLRGLYGIAIDTVTDSVYVTDYPNNRVQKFTANGVYITHWGEYGSGPGQFDIPNGIAVDKTGYVYVSDRYNRIQRFDPNGGFLNQWTTRLNGDGDLTLLGDLATDSSGNIYGTATSKNRIQKYSSIGTFLLEWGHIWVPPPGGGTLNNPYGIAIAPSGRIYVSDANHRVQVYGMSVQRTLTMQVTGSGTTDPIEGTHVYNDGDVVNITATPAAGWKFDSWSGDVDYPNLANASVTMNADKTVTANFSEYITQYTLNMQINGSGSTFPALGSHVYNDGTVVTVIATPAAGWQFVNWTGDVANPNAVTTTVTVNANKTVTANFSRSLPTQYSLTMQVNGSGSTDPALGTHVYALGTMVNIAATPAAGWQFVNWTGSVANPGSANTSVTMDADKTVTANFSRIRYTLTMSVDGNGSTSPAVGNHTFDSGTVVNITAIPDAGWKFDSWSGLVDNPLNASTFVIMDSDRSVTARFTEIPPTRYNLTMRVNGNGTTNPPLGVHFYDEGTVVNISAIPAGGWQFSGWSGDLSGSTNPTTITMNGDKTVTANFVPQGITAISDIKQNPAGYSGQTVKVSGTYLGWKAGFGSPPVTRSDYLVQDATGYIYVTGSSMGLMYPRDVGKAVEIRGIVRLKNGQPYLELIQTK